MLLASVVFRLAAEIVGAAARIAALSKTRNALTSHCGGARSSWLCMVNVFVTRGLPLRPLQTLSVCR